MAIRIAINGFGRIGRRAFQIALESNDLEILAINDLTTPENLAYLLKYDTVYGEYPKEVSSTEDSILVAGKEFGVISEPDPTKLPWGDLDVDVVIESTGIFTKYQDAKKHMQAGAKKVIISAPTKSQEVPTYILGVNHNDYKSDEDHVVSNASCTTNCVAPVMAVLNNAFGITHAIMTTVHAYTSTQSIVDGPSKKDFRRGRAAAENIVPASTGAAVATTKTISSLEGKFDGVALRVPVPVGSISDVTMLLKEQKTVDEVNNAFRAAAKNPLYKGILTVTESPLVSSDIVGNPHSAIVDLEFTRVVGPLVKVLAWYDNEYAYSKRLVEQAVVIGKALRS